MSQEITPVNEITDVQIARENAAFEMLQRQARMFASSSLVPKEFQGNVANCAIGINIAKRLGADPFMIFQALDIIHGRPSFRATFLIAMVNASGRFDPLQFEMQGAEGKPDRACIAWAKSKSDGSRLDGPKITLEMAKAEGWSTKNGSKWLTMPELMLRYRAAAFFARLYAPDITLGMMTAEEAQDTTERDVTPPAATTSKLFQSLPAATEAAPAVETHPEPESPSEATQTPLERVKWLIEDSNVTWLQAMTVLMRNKVVTEEYETPDAAPDSVLDNVTKYWASVVKLTKGGAK